VEEAKLEPAAFENFEGFGKARHRVRDCTAQAKL
jgi:hypothetical protein